MWPNPQFPADLVTFTEKIINGKPHFLCSVKAKNEGLKNLLTNLSTSVTAHLHIMEKQLDWIQFQLYLFRHNTMLLGTFEQPILWFFGKNNFNFKLQNSFAITCSECWKLVWRKCAYDKLSKMSFNFSFSCMLVMNNWK